VKISAKNQKPRRVLSAIAIAALILFACAAAHRVFAAPGGSQTFTMDFAGRTRNYIRHVPASYSAAKPVALVMVLHGGGQSPESAERMSQMSERAETQNFIAVYPRGTGRLANVPTWNAGSCCTYAMENRIDDVGFLGALIEKLERDYSVNPRQVYVTGISNGGMMSYRVACELSEKIAAIAPVEGAQDSECKPTAPVSLLIFHGTADRLVPFDGGTTRFQSGPRRSDNSVANAISFWLKQDGCGAVPEHKETPEVHVDNYSGCKGGTGVALYAIQGGHHMWPGLAISGNHVEATDIMLKFFFAHPKP
jgi:polyhydroxybutyrate depolymerase